jgi:hypothetical protein
MDKQNTDNAAKLAKEHCEYLKTLFEKAFIDGFIHGYKHGLEAAEAKDI